MAGRCDASCLASGPSVHPHDRRPAGPAGPVQGQHGGGRSPNGDAGYLLRRYATFLRGLLHGRPQARPPLIGILLGPAWSRVLRFERDAAEDDRCPLTIEYAYPDASSAVVDTDQVGALPAGDLVHGVASTLLTCQHKGRHDMRSWFAARARVSGVLIGPTQLLPDLRRQQSVHPVEHEVRTVRRREAFEILQGRLTGEDQR